MEDRPCTVTLWRVRPGREGDFVKVARELAEVLLRLPERAAELTLAQGLEDGGTFYTFGWWHRPEDLAAMRDHPAAQARYDQLEAMCTEWRPGDYRVVMTAGDHDPR